MAAEPRQPEDRESAVSSRQLPVRQTIMGDLIPPAIHATAADVPEPIDALRPDNWTIFSGDTVWWRPGWAEIARAIGWWWFALVPSALGAIGLIAGMVFAFQRHFPIEMAIKLAFFLAAIAITIVIRASKRSVRVRKDTFCVHCGYSMEGAGDMGTCPECGRAFSRWVSEEFRKDPHFFAMRHEILRRAPRFEPFAAGVGPTPDDGTRGS
jgi:hypothetical protein